ncbi:MAG: GSCFA domain-containing protein [Prevotellaceae bacterium]|jgi:hypothetical protein|nr:GSCFA domain-containing protein [Prevotellaceae bacterium]
MYFTPVAVPDYPFKLSYGEASFWIGSCFTDNIGNAMKSLKFHCEVNPVGVLYNPFSILATLEMLAEKSKLKPDDLFEFNELWSSFLFHGSFSGTDKMKTLENMNNKLALASNSLYNSRYLFITFGTAYVYQLKDSGEIVANCHKLPATKFEHKLLTTNEIVEQYSRFINKITELLPELRIIFSVSPVRHLKDGAINNQIGKSILILSINEIIDAFPDKCHYFPAYEIVTDELRDYRFYAKDMCHLSEIAIEHINKVFVNSMLNEQALKIMREIEKLNIARSHRPFHRDTNSYRQFVDNTNKMEAELQKRYPCLNWNIEQEQC